MAAPRRTVALIGASAGIGAALARELGPRYNLVLVARRPAELDALAATLPAAVTVAADASSRASMAAVVPAAVKAFGGIDVWVNNVGRGITRSVFELTDDDLDEMVSINVKSMLIGSQLAVSHFTGDRGGTGHLLCVSSFLGKVPAAPHRSAYSACKAAVNSLCSTMRLQLAAEGHTRVHVTTIIPGLVFTDFAANAVGAAPAAKPSGAGQTAEEVAAIIAGVIDAGAEGDASAVPVEVFTQGAAQADQALKFASDVGGSERLLAGRLTAGLAAAAAPAPVGGSGSGAVATA